MWVGNVVNQDGVSKHLKLDIHENRFYFDQDEVAAQERARIHPTGPCVGFHRFHSRIPSLCRGECRATVKFRRAWGPRCEYSHKPSPRPGPVRSRARKSGKIEWALRSIPHRNLVR